MLIDILVMFSSPGELVLDTSGGTSATAKACMLLLQHRCLEGCTRGVDSKQKYFLSLVEVFARRRLNPEPYIEGSDEVKAAA